jgi:hypothetical protein
VKSLENILYSSELTIYLHLLHNLKEIVNKNALTASRKKVRTYRRSAAKTEPTATYFLMQHYP